MTAPPIFCLVRRCQIVIRSSMPLSDFDPFPPEEQPRRRIARRSIAEVRRDCGDVRRRKPRPRWPALYRTGGWPVRSHVASCKTSCQATDVQGARRSEGVCAVADARAPPEERLRGEIRIGEAEKKGRRKRGPIYQQFVKASRSRAGEAPLFSRRAAGSAVGARGQSPVTIADDAVAFARCSLQPPAVDYRDRAAAKPDQAFAL